MATESPSPTVGECIEATLKDLLKEGIIFINMTKTDVWLQDPAYVLASFIRCEKVTQPSSIFLTNLVTTAIVTTITYPIV